MKRFIEVRLVVISILLLALYVNSSSQVSCLQLMNDFSYSFSEVVIATEEHFSKNGTGQGSGYKQYMRWRYLNEEKYDLNGNRNNVDHLISAKTYKQFLKNYPDRNKKSKVSSWVELSLDYSTLHLFNHGKGIGSGGFWRTFNGDDSWVNTTDGLIASGVNTISVNPLNTNQILINIQNPFNEISHRIYQSLNKGDSWTFTDFYPTHSKLKNSYGVVNILAPFLLMKCAVGLENSDCHN